MLKLDRIDSVGDLEKIEITNQGTIRITNINFEGKKVQTEYYIDSKRQCQKIIEELQSLYK